MKIHPAIIMSISGIFTEGLNIPSMKGLGPSKNEIKRRRRIKSVPVIKSEVETRQMRRAREWQEGKKR